MGMKPRKRWFWVTKDEHAPGVTIWPNRSPRPSLGVNGDWSSWWQVGARHGFYVYPDRRDLFLPGVKVPTDRPIRVAISAEVIEQ